MKSVCKILLLSGAFAAAFSQPAPAPQGRPPFSLTISGFYPAGAGTPGDATFRELRVDETNLSNEPLQEGPFIPAETQWYAQAALGLMPDPRPLTRINQASPLKMALRIPLIRRRC